MTPTAQVGSILIERWPLMTQLRDVTSEPYCGDWSLLKVLSGSAFDRSVRASGWNFFFMAGELKATFLGVPGAQRIENAVKRILGKMKSQNFNGLEVTRIVGKRFLGIPYATVFAHPRHLQQSCSLDGAQERRESSREAQLAGA